MRTQITTQRELKESNFSETFMTLFIYPFQYDVQTFQFVFEEFLK